jgi:hypothetical protein
VFLSVDLYKMTMEGVVGIVVGVVVASDDGGCVVGSGSGGGGGGCVTGIVVGDGDGSVDIIVVVIGGNVIVGCWVGAKVESTTRLLEKSSVEESC